MYFRVLIGRPAFAQMKDSVLTLTIYTVVAGASTVIIFGASAVQSGATVEAWLRCAAGPLFMLLLSTFLVRN